MTITESSRVDDQTSPEWTETSLCHAVAPARHSMISVKTKSMAMPYVEVCGLCGWIDHLALTRRVENAIKEWMTERAKRIAVAVDLEPFRFVQSSFEELSLLEILTQAFAALAHHSAVLGAKGDASTGQRETAILRATLAEVERHVHLSRSAATSSDKEV